jgi:hypothetical protein
MSGNPDRELFQEFGPVWLCTSKARLPTHQREQDDDNDGSKSGELLFSSFKHHNVRCLELVHPGRGLELRRGAESGGCRARLMDLVC